MTYVQAFNLNETKLYYAYRRTSADSEQFQGTFHAHQGIEILIVHEGSGTLVVDQKSYEIAPGTLCVFQPYQLHHIQMDIRPQSPFVRTVIQFEPSLYEDYFDKWPGLLAFFKQVHTSKLPYPCLYNLDEDDPLHALLQRFDRKRSLIGKRDEPEELSLFLIEFFHAFKSIWETRSGQLGSGLTRKVHQAERILVWLESHYAEPLRLKQMAAELHLSPYHLSHLFKECTGSSISDYVTARRLQQAIKLLTSTDQAVARIGEAIGVTNCSYFCKLFKSHYGVTPHQYRKLALTPQAVTAGPRS